MISSEFNFLPCVVALVVPCMCTKAAHGAPGTASNTGFLSELVLVIVFWY